MKNIDVRILDEMLKNNDKIILLDVRDEEEYEKRHIRGAISIQNYELEWKIDSITKNKEDIIVIYCSSGIRSKTAQNILKNLGFKNVYNLEGAT